MRRADNPDNGSEEDPILQIEKIRTDLDVFAQVLYCDKGAILRCEGQISNHPADVPSLIPRKWIFI